MHAFISRTLAVLAVSLAVSLTPAQDATRGQRVIARTAAGELLDLYDESHALVVGVSDYNQGWRRLPGVKSDVPAVSAALRQQGFRVTTLLDPTVEDFERAMRAFISAHGLKERNRLVVYFAGHGHTERLGDDRDLGYIVMRNAPRPDTDPAGFAASAVSMDQMEAYATRIKSKHALFVFDSCFSGSIFRSEPDKRRPARIESKSAGPVRQFITSGNAGQEVPDDSIFRRYFVRAFESEGDLDNDGYVTGEELGIFLSGRVASDSRDTQTPRYGKIRDARLNVGDLVFVLPKKETPKPPNPTPAPPADRCAIAWDSVKSTESEQTLESFLAGCKDSPQAFAANLRLNDLRARRRPDPPASVTTAPAPARMSAAGVALSALAPFTTVKVDANGRITERRANQESWGYVEDLGNGARLEMVEIPPGEFLMGEDAAGAADYEKECARYFDKTRCAAWAKTAMPQRRVKLNGFLMGKYEVTQGQWKAVMGALPPNMASLDAKFKGDDLPMVDVSWEEARDFIQKLNEKLKLTRSVYQLPSEAEWEYAARAGSRTPFAFGETISPETANYWWDNPHRNAPKKEHLGHSVKVGSYPANAFGLYDLHGNVWEWCEDDWHDSYAGAPLDGSAWVDSPSRGSYRVYRGGGWGFSSAVYCRSAFRYYGAPGNIRNDNLGFRLLRTYR